MLGEMPGTIEARIVGTAGRLGGSASLFVDGERLGVFVGNEAGPLKIRAGVHSVHVRLGVEWTEAIEVVAEPGERVQLICRYRSHANATARGLVNAAFVGGALVLQPLVQAAIPGPGFSATLLVLGLCLVFAYFVLLRLVVGPISDLELVQVKERELVR